MEYHSILLDIFYVQVRSDMKLIFIEELYAVQHLVIIKTQDLFRILSPLPYRYVCSDGNIKYTGNVGC